MLPPLRHCSYWNRFPQFFASSTARSHFSSCSREAVASILAWVLGGRLPEAARTQQVQSVALYRRTVL